MLEWAESTDYHLDHRIGYGGYGQVYQVQLKEKKYAVKRFDTRNNGKFADGVTEASILVAVRGHPQLIQLHQVGVSESSFDLVMELGTCTLDQIIERTNYSKIDIPRMTKYAFQLCCAVESLHNLGILHNDLKPSNVLLVDDQVKLADFGISSSIFAGRTEVISTIWYMPPEAAFEMSGNYAIDIWGLGCTLYHLFEGQPLIKADKYNYLENVASKVPGLSQELLEWFNCSKDQMWRLLRINNRVRTDLICSHRPLNQLLLQMLRWAPSKRIDIFSVLHSALFESMLEPRLIPTAQSMRAIIDKHLCKLTRLPNLLSKTTFQQLFEWEGGLLLETPRTFGLFLGLICMQASDATIDNEVGLSAAYLIASKLTHVDYHKFFDCPASEIYLTEEQLCRQNNFAFHISTPVDCCLLLSQGYNHELRQHIYRLTLFGMGMGLMLNDPWLLAEAALHIACDEKGFFSYTNLSPELAKGVKRLQKRWRRWKTGKGCTSMSRFGSH